MFAVVPSKIRGCGMVVSLCRYDFELEAFSVRFNKVNYTFLHEKRLKNIDRMLNYIIRADYRTEMLFFVDLYGLRLYMSNSIYSPGPLEL